MVVNQPLVTIQVVTYNSESDIEDCLDTIKFCSYSKIEIVIIDNCSSDRTRQKIQDHSLFNSKKLHSFFLKENLGYAEGHNFASKQAKGKYLLLLNADSTLSPNCIEPLVEQLESDNNLFACQPLILLKDDHVKINLTGKVTQYLGYDWLRDYRSLSVPCAGEVISISGAGVLIRAVYFEKIGRFDQQYFMYYEDSDISWRARLAGFSLFFQPKSIVYHDYKYIPNIKQQSLQQKIYFVERNRLLTIMKNYSLKSLLLLLPALLLNELALTLYAALSGFFMTKLKSYWSLWKARTTLLYKRNAAQQMRKVSDAKIVADFVAKVDFVHFDHPALKYLLNPFFITYWFLIKKLI